MKLENVQVVLEARLALNKNRADYSEREIGSCFASDLISDMLLFTGHNSILLTGLTNAQVIRTAEILDLVAICFVRNKEPRPETIKLAEEKRMPLLVTHLTMYESCGRLYEKGLSSAIERR